MKALLYGGVALLATAVVLGFSKSIHPSGNLKQIYETKTNKDETRVSEIKEPVVKDSKPVKSEMKTDAKNFGEFIPLPADETKEKKVKSEVKANSKSQSKLVPLPKEITREKTVRTSEEKPKVSSVKAKPRKVRLEKFSRAPLKEEIMEVKPETKKQ